MMENLALAANGLSRNRLMLQLKEGACLPTPGVLGDGAVQVPEKQEAAQPPPPCESWPVKLLQGFTVSQMSKPCRAAQAA